MKDLMIRKRFSRSLFEFLSTVFKSYRFGFRRVGDRTEQRTSGSQEEYNID